MSKSLIVIFIFLTFHMAHSQVEKFKVAYLYNITRLVEWPPEYRYPTFKIGTIGKSDALQKELDALSKTKKINGKSIEILKFQSTADIKDCNILVILPGQNVEAVTKLVGTKSIMLFSNEDKGIPENVDVNFIYTDNKLKFELRYDFSQSKRILINKQLKSMASNVY